MGGWPAGGKGPGAWLLMGRACAGTTATAAAGSSRLAAPPLLAPGLLPSPDTPVAATGIAYNIQSLIYMLPFGLSYAVCARVGRHLGASRPAGAKLAGEGSPPADN